MRAVSRGLAGPQRDAGGGEFEVEEIGAHGVFAGAPVPHH
jgi:hypothetical protein